MPIYDFSCVICGRVDEVILLGDEAEPTCCPDCSGELHRQVSRFSVVSRRVEDPAPMREAGASCGHTGGCRCSVRLTRPNPFADRLVAGGQAEV